MDREEPGDVGRLLELAVSDLALIERLRLELAPGLNVITGETGAGKSLLIDALGLALGARADSGLVRHGADVARVEALFDRVPEPLICVREVTASGRSTARIDDQTVTAARLADVAGPLVEIHGQHDQQRLLDERRQRDLLDAYGGHADPRGEMSAAVERWRANRSALEALSLDPREIARLLDIQRHEAAEIEAAKVRVGEAAEIRATLEAAQHGEAIGRAGTELLETLVGEPRGAREGLAVALRSVRQLERLDPRYAPLVARIAGLEAEVEDVASEARGLVESVDHDPAELHRFEERLSLLYGLERRYGEDEAAIIAYGERAAAEADRLEGLEGERERRAADDARLLLDVAAAGARLSDLRRAAAADLGERVSEALRDLGFRDAAFEVAVGRRVAGADEAAVEVDGDAVAFDASGIDQVVFRLAPNPGEPARPLARIASGGELSRVALAIKAVLADADATPTLVFDEVDAGIGGRGGDLLGRRLWSLGRSHQVLCVTHLPQIAAHADEHFQIAKREHDGRTVTDIRRLDHEGRIVELSHMIGGASPGTAAMAGAREMLDRVEAWRTGAGVGA